MRKIIPNKIKLKSYNNHLLNVFDNINYLSLGVINYTMIEKILNYKIININTIINDLNLPLEELNKIKKEINNSVFYFKNIESKEPSNQLFLTYGLLVWKDENNRDMFSPLCLIPVDFYITNDDIYLYLTSNPIENPILIKELIQKDINFSNQHERLNNLPSIDKYCFSFTKNRNFKVDLKNYLTFGEIEFDDVIINHDKFFVDRDIINKVGYDHILLGRNYGENLYPLNINQKIALGHAAHGYSFGIEGTLGTGKTTTLFNIAASAMAMDKRVLYISNNFDSISFIEELSYDLGISDYCFNAVKFLENDLREPKEIEKFIGDSQEIKNNIRFALDFVNQYETDIFSRIRNNLLLEVINYLIIADTDNLNNLNLPPLTRIYKHEFEEIRTSLYNIEKLLKSGFNIKESVWNNIPINHNIRYPNQVLTLLYKMNKSFRQLDAISKQLSDEFGFKTYDSYVKLNQLRRNYKSISKLDYPADWVSSDFKKFFAANDEFENLSNIINEYYYYYDSIKEKYSINALELDFEEYHSILYSDYFNEEEYEKLDKILLDKIDLNKNIDKSNSILLNHINLINELEKELQWQFSNSDYELGLVANLYSFVSSNSYHPDWLNYNTIHKSTTAINNITNIKEKYDEYQNELNSFYRKHPKLNIEYIKNKYLIFNNSKDIINFGKTDSVRRNGLNIDNDLNYLQDLADIVSILNKIKVLEDEYLELTSFEIKDHNIIYERMINLFNFLESIEDKELNNVVIKYLKNRPQTSIIISQYINYNNDLMNLYYEEYVFLSNYIESLRSYGFEFKCQSYLENINELSLINDYLLNTFKLFNDIKLIINYPGDLLAEHLHQLSEWVEKMNKLDDIINNTPSFSDLFGHLYLYHQTDVNSISKTLRYFEDYLNVFESLDKAYLAFSQEVNLQILTLMDLVASYVDTLNELFTLYVKMFNDNISKYYFDIFEQNINYLENLMVSKDELIYYLEMTNEFHLLLQYNLDSLVSQIINNNELRELNTSFTYQYYQEIYDEFIYNHPHILNTNEFKEKLDLIVLLESELIEYYRYRTYVNITKEFSKSNDYFTNHLVYLNNYLKRNRNSKALVLSNIKTVNNYIDINQFDLVLIDDAHLTSLNEYDKVLKIPQVIIAGEEDKVIKRTLISKMLDKNIIKFDYRYLATPKNLLDINTSIDGLIHNDYYRNQGLEIISDNIVDYIMSLFKENKDIKVNVFVRTLSRQRALIEELKDKFDDDVYLSKNQAYIFNHQLNIASLKTRHVINANINILDLSTYSDEFSVLNPAQMLLDLFNVEDRVVIYDPVNLLGLESQNKFFNLFKDKVSDVEMSFDEHLLRVGIVYMIASEFKKYSIRPIGSHSDIDLILESNNSLYGILIYWNFDNINYQTIENYHKIYTHYINNGWEIKVICFIDLLEDFSGLIQQIANEIGDSHDG